jgi:hypothetical protein
MPCRPEDLSPPTRAISRGAPELESALTADTFLRPLKPLFDKFRQRWAVDLERPTQHYLLHLPTPDKLETSKPVYPKTGRRRATTNPLVNKDPLRAVKRWGVDREVIDEQVRETVFATLLEFPPADGKYFPEEALVPVRPARRVTPGTTFVAALMDIPVVAPVPKTPAGPVCRRNGHG